MCKLLKKILFLRKNKKKKIKNKIYKKILISY